MTRGKKEWNCWSLPCIYGLRDLVGKIIIKTTINTVTKNLYKTANTAQDQLEIERWK